MAINNIDFEARREGIGGSDIASVLGISPYKSAYELYEEKVSGLQQDLSNNDAVTWGNVLEQPIAQYYEKITNRPLCSSSTFKHKKYSFLIANPDRLVIGESRGLEIKTAGEHMKYLWGEAGSKQIPEHYYAQIAHYMMVLDYQIWDIAVLIGGRDFRLYTFERDKELEEIILEQSIDFWQNRVLAKDPPPIDYSAPGIKDLIKRKFNLVSDEVIQLPDECVELTDEYERAKRIISDGQKVKDEIEARLLEKIGNAGVARLPDGRAFMRKLISRKGYTVPSSSYITLNLKKGA